MEENNVVQEQPVQEPVAEETQVAEAQVSEQVAETTVETEETSEAPQAEEAPKQPNEEPEVNFDLTRFLQPEPQAPQFTPDEEGYIDPNQLYTKILTDAKAAIKQEMAFEESERRAWGAIENKYPEIKEDPELRDLVNAQRIADVARGGKGDLNQIAGKVLGKIQSYQTRGKAQAQVSEKVQKSASLQSTTANNVDTSKTDDLLNRMASGDNSAADELISDWLASGKL